MSMDDQTLMAAALGFVTVLVEANDEEERREAAFNYMYELRLPRTNYASFLTGVGMIARHAILTGNVNWPHLSEDIRTMAESWSTDD